MGLTKMADESIAVEACILRGLLFTLTQGQMLALTEAMKAIRSRRQEPQGQELHGAVSVKV